MVYEATGALQHAVIDAAAGDTELVAAVTGKRIRVLSFSLVAADALTARFESGAGGTALTGIMDLAANQEIGHGHFHPGGHFETAAGEALSLELSAGTADGYLTYQLI